VDRKIPTYILLVLDLIEHYGSTEFNGLIQQQFNRFKVTHYKILIRSHTFLVKCNHLHAAQMV